MATGRIGATPVLRVRWSKLPTTGTTVLSGLDDNSVALVYDAGYEAVYRNGVLLSRGNDYTATDGTTVTLIDATLAGDVIEIFANDLVPLTDAISKGQFTAKGALLSASAASTPGVVTVGANDTVLTADSSTATGLKWATPASGQNWSLLNAGGTALTGAQTITVSGISAKNDLMIIVANAGTVNTDSVLTYRLNADTGANYTSYGQVNQVNNTNITSQYGSLFMAHNGNGMTSIPMSRNSDTDSNASGYLRLSGCNSSGVKVFQAVNGVSNNNAILYFHYNIGGFYSSSSTISSVSIISSSGNFDNGTIFVYTSA
jgi:hypothetical protein